MEKVLHNSRSIHEFWATFISLGVALYILYTHLGVAFIAPFLTALIATATCTWIGKLMRPRFAAWAATTETRVTTIAYTISCMKGVRMLGLSETVLQMLTRLRELEVTTHNKARKLFVWVVLISNVMFQLSTVATYVTFTIIALLKKDGSFLDSTILYGSLSALKLVTSPLLLVLQLIPGLQSALASLDRIQRFLKSESIDQDVGNATAADADNEGIELLPLVSQDVLSNENSSPIVTTMRDATFMVDEKSLIHNVNLQVRSGSFTMIIGKVGSGKSILLRSIIGETKLKNGTFHPPSSGIAYCDQSVWLRNCSVRENIIGEDPLDEAWYNSVLYSCGLIRDLTEMKKTDMTPIGSKGISLSGGQRNRIALARAIYARKPILILDDMLSGLDNSTENLVFDRVFGPKGLLRKAKATIVLITHATYFARHADRVLVISNGRIVENGTYQQLQAKNVDLHSLSMDEHNDQPDLNEDNGANSGSSENIITLSAEQTDDDEEEEDAARRSGDRRSLLFFLKAVGRFHSVLYLVFLVVTTVATTIQCK